VKGILYLLCIGIPMCFFMMCAGVIFCCTIIGIPIGLTFFAMGVKFLFPDQGNANIYYIDRNER
jgi:uncharacterized membrane protein YccF (DUF307 family)